MVNIYLIPCPQPIMDNQIHNPNRLMPVRGQAEIFLLILDYKVDKKTYQILKTSYQYFRRINFLYSRSINFPFSLFSKIYQSTE